MALHITPSEPFSHCNYYTLQESPMSRGPKSTFHVNFCVSNINFQRALSLSFSSSVCVELAGVNIRWGRGVGLRFPPRVYAVPGGTPCENCSLDKGMKDINLPYCSC